MWPNFKGGGPEFKGDGSTIKVMARILRVVTWNSKVAGKMCSSNIPYR